MQKIALVDFDHTLVRIDTLEYILKNERWWLNPIMIFWGAVLFVYLKVLNVSRSKQLYIRSQFKKELLDTFSKQNESWLEKYVEYFKTKIHTPLIEHIGGQQYDSIIVVSASESNLIELVLKDILPVDVIIGNDSNNLSTFTTCWYSEKVRRLQEKVDLSNAHISVYTDSYDDTPLIELAHTFYHIKKDENYDFVEITS